MSERIILELSHDEWFLLVQGCSLGLQQAGVLSAEERTQLRSLVQKIARESRNEQPEAE